MTQLHACAKASERFSASFQNPSAIVIEHGAEAADRRRQIDERPPESSSHLIIVWLPSSILPAEHRTSLRFVLHGQLPARERTRRDGGCRSIWGAGGAPNRQKLSHRAWGEPAGAAERGGVRKRPIQLPSQHDFPGANGYPALAAGRRCTATEGTSQSDIGTMAVHIM